MEKTKQKVGLVKRWVTLIILTTLILWFIDAGLMSPLRENENLLAVTAFVLAITIYVYQLLLRIERGAFDENTNSGTFFILLGSLLIIGVAGINRRMLHLSVLDGHYGVMFFILSLFFVFLMMILSWPGVYLPKEKEQ